MKPSCCWELPWKKPFLLSRKSAIAPQPHSIGTDHWGRIGTHSPRRHTAADVSWCRNDQRRCGDERVRSNARRAFVVNSRRLGTVTGKPAPSFCRTRCRLPPGGPTPSLSSVCRRSNVGQALYRSLMSANSRSSDSTHQRERGSCCRSWVIGSEHRALVLPPEIALLDPAPFGACGDFDQGTVERLLQGAPARQGEGHIGRGEDAVGRLDRPAKSRRD